MIYTKEWAFIHIPKTAGLNFILRMEKKPEVINAQWNLQKKTGLKDVNHLPLQWWLDIGEL